ncbi:hypothetical protein [Acerihabitans arboris]|uniref:Uncharacterized protein n=1 Tax=Acerihabitans arboris TaxID=2691583 RepID=A0A845SSW9_9GAMM|nr:hypothetical protein [Acerihabitans arboris]NDL66014.1 hypothetical protein [Acerihabitans arboris]
MSNILKNKPDALDTLVIADFSYKTHILVFVMRIAYRSSPTAGAFKFFQYRLWLVSLAGVEGAEIAAYRVLWQLQAKGGSVH